MSKQLESEVWNVERCAGCGACVVACSKRILSFEEDGEHPIKKVIWKNVGFSTSRLDVCRFCEMEAAELCEFSCPRMAEDWPEGPVLKKMLVQATGNKKSGNSNEVIANMLIGTML